MGRAITTRSVTVPVAGTFAAQVYGGCAELVGLTADYGTSASGSVLTIKEKDADGLTKFTVTTDTDFGTTVPVRVFHDARLIAGTATAGVGLNPVFFDGIYVSVTGDSSSTTSTVIHLYLRPLIKKSVDLSGVTDSQVAFQGPGLLKGARANYIDPDTSTTDLQIRDGVGPGTTGRALTVVSNSATDWAAVNQQLVTTTNLDEAGTGVTTAATGSYANDGVCFRTGLNVDKAQGTATGMTIVDLAIEA